MAWYHRLFNIARGERLSAELDREQQFHIDELFDALVEQGMDPDEARREALRRFGHRQKQKDDTRDADVLVWLESLLADLRYAARSLRLSPGFTFVAVLSIGLGVGANTAIFGLINAVMLRSLPVSRPEQLVMLARGEEFNDSFTNPLWEAIRDQQQVVDAFAYGDASFNLARGGEVQRAAGTWVSGSFFPVLGVRAAAGRLLGPADDYRGCAPVAVVSSGFASSRFGSPGAAVGGSVALDGHPFEIVGVTAPEFIGVDVASRPQIYTPICAEAVLQGPETGLLTGRSTWWLQIMARPRPGYSLEQVRAGLAAASPGIHSSTQPDNWPDQYLQEYLRTTIKARPAAGGFSSARQRYSEALLVLMAVSGVVLLIACTNVAHLLMARAAARQREMAVRLAIGAGRARLVRQLLTESLLLSALGALAGTLFARWAGPVMVRMLSTRSSPMALDLGFDARMLAFTIGIVTVTGLLFGLLPAWRAVRVSPQAAMQAGSRGQVSGRARFAVTRALVVGQVALSLVLLVGAGLLVRSFQKLLTLDPGFQRKGVLLVGADYQNTGFSAARRLEAFHELLERLRALPGVSAASAVRVPPISGMGWNNMIQAEGFEPRGERDGLFWMNAVSSGYFETMGTGFVAGRDFDRRDAASGQKVAIVNESMARRVFGTANPLGRTFRVASGRGVGEPIEIVGVVRDARYRSLRDDNTGTAYLPLAQAELWGTDMNFALRTPGEPAALTAQVRDLAREVNGAIALEFVTLEDQVNGSLTRPRVLATLSGFFGILALLLATVGLYGTVAYSVERRHGEIGVRIALGAARGRVVRMVLGEVTRLLVPGTLAGVGIALASSRLLRGFLYALSPTDPLTLVLAAALLALVALLAGALPAWRAARLDPMTALRAE